MLKKKKKTQEEKFEEYLQSEEMNELIEKSVIFLEICHEKIEIDKKDMLGKSFDYLNKEYKYELLFRENERLTFRIWNEEKDDSYVVLRIENSLYYRKYSVNTFTLRPFYYAEEYFPKIAEEKLSPILEVLKLIHNIYFDEKNIRIAEDEFERKWAEKKKRKKEEQNLSDFRYAYEKVKRDVKN